MPTSSSAEELRARVHGVALTAAQTTVAPSRRTAYTDERLAKSSVGKGWGSKFSENKVKRDTDPGEEGQFDFKDPSKKKGGRGGGKGGGAAKKAAAATKKAAAEAERARKKALSDTEKRASDARSGARKSASARKAAETRARRDKPRPVDDIQRDINDAIAEMRAEEAARGLKPGQDYPGKMDQQVKVALLRLELKDAELGEDATIAERIALRERNLEAMRNADPGDGPVPPEILKALEDDLEAFKAKQAEVEGEESERNTKKTAAEVKKSESAAKKTQSVAKSTQRTDQNRAISDAQRKRDLAMSGIQSSGGKWSPDARKDAAIKGHSLPDGSFPVVNTADWYKALQASGRVSNRTVVVEHLKKRGKALGIPESELDGVT